MEEMLPASLSSSYSYKWYPEGASLSFAAVLIHETRVDFKVWLSDIVEKVEDWEPDLGSKRSSTNLPTDYTCTSHFPNQSHL